MDVPTNKDRIKRAERTLDFYKHRALGESGPVDEDTMVDFLADLRHFADKQGLDIYHALDLSYTHYTAELYEERYDEKRKEKKA